MEMQVYIVNLGKYNEGESVVAWFHPTIDMEEVKEKIGLNEQYEKYAIHDYEVSFEISEYMPLSEVNRLCAWVEEIEGTSLFEELNEIQQNWFSNVEEVIENQEGLV